MNHHRPYLSLWLLLAAALAVVVAVSAFGPVKIGSYTLRDSGAYTFLTAHHDSNPGEILADTSDLAPESMAFPDIKAIVEPDTLPKTILFIGDSMLDGLYPRLAAYAQENGHTLYAVIWYSSHSEAWGRSGRLKEYVDKVQPDFIFICLGSNELFVRDIVSKRDGYVASIIAQADTVPYLWIGPPNWKPDTGINDLIKKHAATGCYFCSDGMTFTRGKDGAHPTRESAAEWMDSIIRWMPANHPHPFRLEVPAQKSARAKKVYVHQPSEI